MVSLCSSSTAEICTFQALRTGVWGSLAVPRSTGPTHVRPQRQVYCAVRSASSLRHCLHGPQRAPSCRSASRLDLSPEGPWPAHPTAACCFISQPGPCPVPAPSNPGSSGWNRWESSVALSSKTSPPGVRMRCTEEQGLDSSHGDAHPPRLPETGISDTTTNPVPVALVSSSWKECFFMALGC